MQLKTFALSLFIFSMAMIPILSSQDYAIGYFQFDLENPGNTEEINEFQEVKWRAKQAYESQYKGTLGDIKTVYKQIINSGINYKIFFQTQNGLVQITTFTQWTGNVEVTNIKFTEQQGQKKSQNEEQQDSVLQQIEEIEKQSQEDFTQEDQLQKIVKQLDQNENAPISINQEKSVGNLQRQAQSVDKKEGQIEFKPVQTQEKNFLQQNFDFNENQDEIDDLSAKKQDDEEQWNFIQNSDELANRLKGSAHRRFGYKSQASSLKSWLDQ